MGFEGFTADERSWLASQRLGRLATVAPDGTVGNAPVTYFVRDDDTIDIGGMRMGATKKFRNVEAGSRVAFVVDIVDTSEGWHPIYLEIRGTAEALRDTDPPADGFSHEVIRTHPNWVRSFNFDIEIRSTCVLVAVQRRCGGRQRRRLVANAGSPLLRP